MYRVTEQRKSIVDIIKRLGHSNLSEIYNELSKEYDKIALSTIYRSLESLEEQKVIRRLSSKYGEDFYEYFNQTKHDHFICSKCGKIYDIPKTKLSLKKLKENGFEVEESTTLIYGICKNCLNETSKCPRHL